MEEKPVDRRVRKTKRQLRLALMQLMSEKNVKDISVRGARRDRRYQPRHVLHPL